MNPKIDLLIAYGRQQFGMARDWWLRHWKNALALSLLVFIILKKDVAIDLELNGAVSIGSEWPLFSWFNSSAGSLKDALPTGWTSEDEQGADVLNTSLLDGKRKSVPSLTSLRNKKKRGDNKPGHSPGLNRDKLPFPIEKDEVKRAEKRRKQMKYVSLYAEKARQEMLEFGIPASITLSQGLLESDAGESRLATSNNNHFGIKCFSKTCKKGHCRNFADDHHKDFFRAYANPEESFRAHSLLLKTDRYLPLFNLDSGDYVGWAYGLKKAGYATDKYYAEKLVYIIEDLELYEYDE